MYMTSDGLEDHSRNFEWYPVNRPRFRSLEYPDIGHLEKDVKLPFQGLLLPAPSHTPHGFTTEVIECPGHRRPGDMVLVFVKTTRIGAKRTDSRNICCVGRARNPGDYGSGRPSTGHWSRSRLSLEMGEVQTAGTTNHRNA